MREKVERAVESLQFRATVGDVAAKAGVKLADADRALKALATDSLATLKVLQQPFMPAAFFLDQSVVP